MPDSEEKMDKIEETPKQEKEVYSSAGYDYLDELDKTPAPDYVGMTISSGIVPLEMRFSQINSCYRKLPVAYRSHTYINSVTMGVISPERYSFATDGTDRGIRLAEWNIVKAMETVKKLTSLGRNIEFVTARCPAKLLSEKDMFEWMKKLMQDNDFHTPEKLCLEFPQSLLFEDEEKMRMSVLNLKLLKVKTMMSGCGANDSPITRLIAVPVDYVLLDPTMTALVDSRNNGNAILSLIGYLRSMHIDVIGEGAVNENQIQAMSRNDCFGYIPSPNFEGKIKHGSLVMTFEEAAAQKETEDM